MDIVGLSAKQLIEKLKSGELSSVDLCKAYIERIKKFEKDVHAWAHFDEKILLEKAEESDCLLYTSPSPRDYAASRMPSSA